MFLQCLLADIFGKFYFTHDFAELLVIAASAQQ